MGYFALSALIIVVLPQNIVSQFLGLHDQWMV
jgi:hypothetical protein